MIVVVVHYPGLNIIGLPPGEAHEAKNLLTHKVTCLSDAAIALTEFQTAQCREEMELQQLADAFNIQLDHREEDSRPDAFWQNRHGRKEMPTAYSRRLPFLYARLFLFALDGVAKAMRVLAAQPWSPADLSRLRDDFSAGLPDLIGVRDTAHHVEDRIRLKGRHEASLRLQPIDEPELEITTGGLLMIDSLINTRYGCTMSDGHFGSIDVTMQSLDLARSVVQASVDSFDWIGPPHSEP